MWVFASECRYLRRTEMLGPPGAGILCGFELLIMEAGPEVNLGLLEEQYTLLPIEPFL